MEAPSLKYDYGFDEYRGLSVIINTFNRAERLGRCLEALCLQGGGADCEVIVVDDGGDVELGGVKEKFKDKLNLRIERIAHAGRAAARNRGLELATGERVLFLGDDVIAWEGLLKRHWDEKDRNVAVVGPYPIIGLKGSPPFRKWAEPNPQHLIADFENAGAFYFATGNLSADRGKLIELGGFDGRFELYGWEDIDLGLRFERAGGRIRFDTEAKATHDHPPFGRKELWERERQMGYTAWQFAQKWGKEEPEFVGKMKFWGEGDRMRNEKYTMSNEKWEKKHFSIGGFRRGLGEVGIAVLDFVAPGSGLNWKLYERMVFSYRLEGVGKAKREGRMRNEK